MDKSLNIYNISQYDIDTFTPSIVGNIGNGSRSYTYVELQTMVFVRVRHGCSIL